MLPMDCLKFKVVRLYSLLNIQLVSYFCIKVKILYESCYISYNLLDVFNFYNLHTR